jgi:glycosyltransferase involved in cell wall biosynthesis
MADIWPRIRQECPDARLIIAGDKADWIPARGSRPEGVELTGFVEDLDELYRNARVVCCPVQSGAGTRTKIVEAAAYGRPVVSTRIGAEGLGMKDGDSILLRDDPDAFANACVSLFRDDGLARRIGRRAREEAVRSFNRDDIVEKIRREIATAISGTSGPANRREPPALESTLRA